MAAPRSRFLVPRTCSLLVSPAGLLGMTRVYRFRRGPDTSGRSPAFRSGRAVQTVISRSPRRGIRGGEALWRVRRPASSRFLVALTRLLFGVRRGLLGMTDSPAGLQLKPGLSAGILSLLKLGRPCRYDAVTGVRELAKTRKDPVADSATQTTREGAQDDRG